MVVRALGDDQNTLLDAAAKAGRLTQDQDHAINANETQRITDRVYGAFPAPGFRVGHGAWARRCHGKRPEEDEAADADLGPSKCASVWAKYASMQAMADRGWQSHWPEVRGVVAAADFERNEMVDRVEVPVGFRDLILSEHFRFRGRGHVSMRRGPSAVTDCRADVCLCDSRIGDAGRQERIRNGDGRGRRRDHEHHERHEGSEYEPKSHGAGRAQCGSGVAGSA